MKVNGRLGILIVTAASVIACDQSPTTTTTLTPSFAHAAAPPILASSDAEAARQEQALAALLRAINREPLQLRPVFLVLTGDFGLSAAAPAKPAEQAQPASTTGGP